MTNGEKNKNAIKRMTRKHPPLHPAVLNGKVVPCTGLNCAYCDLHTPPFYGGCNDNYEKWLSEEAVLEKKEEKMKKEEIKVGDTVRVTEKGYAKEGEIGLVTGIFNISADGVKTYGVRLDGDFSERVFFENGLEKVKTKKTPPRIVIYQNGDAVTARDLETGETASAVCSKDDTFDIHTGAFIAVSRLTHFEDDIKMMLLETEQIEEDITDMKMRFGALMGEGYKQPEGFSRKEE